MMAVRWRIRSSRQAGAGACRARQFQNVQAGIGAIDDIDVAALVGFDIVGLDRDLASLLAIDGDAALVGRLGDGWDEVADLERMVGIANVERPNAGIEE